MPLFHYQVQSFCIYDLQIAKYLNLGIGVFLLLEVAGIVYLLCKLGPKIKEVTEPNAAAPWNQTYCIFYHYNLQLVRFQLIVLLVYLMFVSFTIFVIQDNWDKYFFSE